MLILAEFSYGGYFKGDKIPNGLDEIQMISQLSLTNVSLRAYIDCRYLPLSFRHFTILQSVFLGKGWRGFAREMSSLRYHLTSVNNTDLRSLDPRI